MSPKLILGNFACKAFYSIALLIVTNSLGSFDLWHNPNCWAGQTVTVYPGANLQSLVNQYPPSTTFLLTPGTYRLQSVVPQSYDSFVGETGAIVSGAALLTNFTQSGAYWVSQAQVTPASSYPGQCLSSAPECVYPEDLFFNNSPKTRVASVSAVGPGTWYLDYSTGNVYMGDDPWGSTVEISLLGYAFSGPATSVTISNLIVEKYACLAGSGAINGTAGSSYWAVERNEVRYNHGIGIGSGDDMFISGNNAHNNGELGIGGGGANVVVQNNQIYYNNYSGYSYYWEAGGAKFSSAQNVTFLYNYSYGNQGPGFWTDTNTQGVLCESNQFTGNQEAAILVELSNNVSIAENYIWNDGYNPTGTGMWWGAGILISDSTYVSVYFNYLANCMNGIGGILANRGTAPNGQPYLLQNLNVNSNVITQGTGIAAGIVVEGSGFDNSVYTSWNNTFIGNTYNLANLSADYFYWLGAPVPLATWMTTPLAE